MTVVNSEGKEGVIIDICNGGAIVLWEDHKIEEWFDYFEDNQIEEN
ncbi:hypothetical protein [Halalkalibacter okhensis]|nr:hypothetical protein [Halalkalibacter okhensis]